MRIRVADFPGPFAQSLGLQSQVSGFTPPILRLFLNLGLKPQALFGWAFSP
jgi:hypothetical protein